MSPISSFSYHPSFPSYIGLKDVEGLNFNMSFSHCKIHASRKFLTISQKYVVYLIFSLALVGIELIVIHIYTNICHPKKITHHDYSFLGNQYNSCLILANISFVCILGFQPIAFDRSARHRELVPNPDKPEYFLYSCSVKGVGTGLVVFPNATIAFPILSPTS